MVTTQLPPPSPAAVDLIDPVTPEVIRSAVHGILHEWWFPMREDSAWLRKHASNYHGFAVITTSMNGPHSNKF